MLNIRSVTEGKNAVLAAYHEAKEALIAYRNEHDFKLTGTDEEKELWKKYNETKNACMAYGIRL